MKSKQNRIEYLDSVRGIAAVLVLIYHVICSHWDWTTIGKFSKIIFNGTGAVAMFFVLSGLVLSLKIVRGNIPITSNFMTQFMVKRILRLYPAFLFALLFYVYLSYNDTSITEVFEESMLIRGRHTLLTPDWTLGVEMALSLFVPFMILIMRKGEKLLIWFLIMTLLVGSNFISEFVLHFGMGVLIANRFKEIETFDTKNHSLFKYKNYCIPILILLFSYRHITNIFPLPSFISYLMYDIVGLSEYTFSSLGSFLILVFIINSKTIQNILSHSIILFIGKISYGIYLSHWFFTKLVMTNFDYILSNYAFDNKTIFFFMYLIFTFMGSVISGWFIYHYVELPFIKISRRIFRKKSML